MSRYFFDDSKDHDYEGEFERPRPIYQPAISPGKVTLTSRIVRAAPPATNNAPAKSSQPSATPVQRKAETTPPIAPVIDSQLSAWDLAIRPDLYSPADADATPIQRKQHHEPEEEVSPLQPSGSGTALPDDVRTQMERALGADFSAVRIHEGVQAAAVGALAYTQGTDIHFQPGQYDPQSQRGRELLGHELTHVVQQSRGRVSATAQIKGVSVNDDAQLEQEADEMGARAARQVASDKQREAGAQSLEENQGVRGGGATAKRRRLKSSATPRRPEKGRFTGTIVQKRQKPTDWVIDKGHYYSDRAGAVKRARTLQQSYTSVQVFRRSDQNWQVRYRLALPTTSTGSSFPLIDTYLYYKDKKHAEARANTLRAYGYVVETFQRADKHWQCRLTRLHGKTPSLPAKTGPDTGYFYVEQASARRRAVALEAIGFQAKVEQRPDKNWHCVVTKLPTYSSESTTSESGTPGNQKRPSTSAGDEEQKKDIPHQNHKQGKTANKTQESSETDKVQEKVKTDEKTQNTSGGTPPQKLAVINKTQKSHKLNDAVVQSFRDFAKEVAKLTGQDLSTNLGDSTRSLGSSTTKVGTDNVSWHKTGRAVDLSQNQKWLIVEDKQGGSMYFTLYLRHKKPATKANPPNIVNFPKGTKFHHSPWGTVSDKWAFVNVTVIAKKHGWEPIPAQSGWESNYNKREWWHFENRGGNTWYRSLREIYSEEKIVEKIKTFAKNNAGANRYGARLKREGVPVNVLRKIFAKVTRGKVSIRCPVGKGNKAANLPKDVQSVQNALVRGKYLAAGKANGSMDPSTIQAIIKAQKAFKLASPDGRIDVGGTTHTKLGKL